MKTTGAGYILAALLGAAGTVGIQSVTAISPERGFELKLVNMEVVFGELPDGGPQASYRACAYQTKVDGGPRLSEPCWRGELRQAGFVPEVLGDGLKALDRAQ
jgi:hypothetical protein